MGTTSFREGFWVGVELGLPKGKNDGSIDGVSYFNCPPRHGLFTREANLALLTGGGGAPPEGSPLSPPGGLAETRSRGPGAYAACVSSGAAWDSIPPTYIPPTCMPPAPHVPPRVLCAQHMPPPPQGLVAIRSFHIAPDRGMSICYFDTNENLNNAFPLLKEFQLGVAAKFEAKADAQKAITSSQSDFGEV